MPLVTTQVTGPGPTPGPEQPPGGLAPRSPLQVTYIDPDGTVWDWSSYTSTIRALTVTGVGSAPAAFTEVSLAGGGSLAQSYDPAKRAIVIGIHVFDDVSQAGLLDTVDRLAWALWTERAGMPAPGRIVIARPDGTSRQIEVYCTSGAEQTDVDSTQDAYQRDTSYALTFESALDPLFSDTDPVGPLVFAAPPSLGGVPPMPPVLLTPGATLGEATVMNDGGADAHPVWTIYGPGQPTLTNVTTGRSFGLDVVLGSGEVVTIDTRPARQSAVDGLGADRWGDLVKTSPRDLWALVKGPNLLNLGMASSGTGSRIEMLYHRRWLRA